MRSAKLGIIDTLSEGFATAHQGLWLIAIPILVDLILWMGPRISIASLVSRFVTLYQKALLNSQVLPLSPGETVDQSVARAQEIGEALSRVNLLSLTAWQLPSLLKATGVPMSPAGSSWAWELEGVWVSLGFGGGALFLGLVAYCFYLSGIAQLVRGELFSLGPFLIRVRRNGLRLLAYFGLLALFGLPVILAFLVITGIVSFFSPEIAAFLATLAFSALLAMLLYLFFVYDAIFLGDIGPLRAIISSARVVWHNFWSSLAFILLTNIILVGTPLAWQLIMRHPVWVILAIGGHAYIAIGTTTAGMIFYRQRYTPQQEEQILRNNPPVQP